MQKRISALLLAMVIVIVSVLGGNTLKVKAASATVAMSPELAAEFYLFLYQLTETAMHVGGANKGLDSKEAMETLRDGVIGYYSVSGEKNVDFEIKTTDGRTFKSYSNSGYRGGLVEYTTADGHTYRLSGDKFCTLLLNGTITLDPDIYNDTDEEPRVNDDDEYVKNMKAMFDAKWEELREIGFKDDSGDPTPSPSPDPEKKPFKNIALVTVGASLVALAGAFVKDLLGGKVEGVAAEDYYTGLGFTGFVFNPDGSFTPLGYVKSFYGNGDGYYLYTSAGSFYGADKYPDLSHIDKPAVAYIENSSMKFVSGAFPYVYQRFEGNVCKYTSDHVSIGNGIMFDSYYVNFPVFDSLEHANSYLNSESLTGLLNGEAYDFPDLATSTAERLQPLTGYEFAPGRLPGINAALSTAAAALPEPGLDPAENTEAYKNALNAALTAALPEPAPEPEPEPDPSPDPGTDGEGESYKRDLRLIFPFCIPFDFIHFIQALSADPVAPCFKIPIKLDSLGIDMVLELDLAWMDPVMEIFRLGELGCFVIMLMASTKKMIGW